MERKEAVKIFFDQVKQAYIESQSSQGIRASGKSASSLHETNLTDTGGQLRGAAYFYQQFHGRRPGKFPPIEDIIQWIKDKGIQPDDISIKSLAFLIARKIAKSGTDIFQGKRPGLNVEDKMLEARKQLVENLKNIAKEHVMKKLEVKPA